MTNKSPAGKRATYLLLKKEQGGKAADAYHAAQKATDDKTARLRALRLAKEAEEAASRKPARRSKPDRA